MVLPLLDGENDVTPMVLADTFRSHIIKPTKQIRKTDADKNVGPTLRSPPAVTEPIKRHARCIHKRQGLKPAKNLLVLGDDEGKQRGLDSVRLASEPTIAVLAAIKVVRHKCHEALIGQLRRELVVIFSFSRRFNEIFGHDAAPMLAYHDWPALVRLDILWHQQDTPCKNLLPDIEDDLITNPLFGVVDLAGTGVSGQIRLFELSQNFLPQIIAIPLSAFNEWFGRARVDAQFHCPGSVGKIGLYLVQKKLVQRLLGISHQMLCVLLQFPQLSLLSLHGVEGLATVHRQPTIRGYGRCDAKQFEESLQGLRGSRAEGPVSWPPHQLPRLKSWLEQGVYTVEFRRDALVCRRD